MKFNIRDIGPEGLRVQRVLPDAQLRDLLASSGVEAGPGPARADLDLELSQAEAQPSVVFVRGALHGRFEVACSRCLAPALIEAAEEDLHATFLPHRSPAAEEELSSEDLDTYSHDGEEVDLEPLVREFLLLAIPMAPVCNEECRGICVGCGAELNREPCRCAAPVAKETAAVANDTTPWADALRRLKKDL